MIWFKRCKKCNKLLIGCQRGENEEHPFWKESMKGDDYHAVCHTVLFMDFLASDEYQDYIKSEIEK